MTIKTYLLLPVLVLTTLVAPGTALAASEPQVKFEVSAQDYVQADGVELRFNIHKKASTLETSTRTMHDLIQKIRGEATAQGIPSKDIQIQSTYMATTEWLFGKDFVVTSIAKITIRKLDTWSGMAKTFTQMDPDMQFSGVDYTYPKGPEIWNTLLSKAMAAMQDKKSQYERHLRAKLRLTALRETQIKPYSQPTGAVFYSKRAAATENLDSGEVSAILPTQLYQLNLDLGFDLDR